MDAAQEQHSWPKHRVQITCSETKLVYVCALSCRGSKSLAHLEEEPDLVISQIVPAQGMLKVSDSGSASLAV